jgi:hypothetical protein
MKIQEPSRPGTAVPKLQKEPWKKVKLQPSPGDLLCWIRSAAACNNASTSPEGEKRHRQAAAESPEQTFGGLNLVEVAASATWRERQDLREAKDTSAGATPRFTPAVESVSPAKTSVLTRRSTRRRAGNNWRTTRYRHEIHRSSISNLLPPRQ